jgi:hypothetical protein
VALPGDTKADPVNFMPFVTSLATEGVTFVATEPVTGPAGGVRPSVAAPVPVLASVQDSGVKLMEWDGVTQSVATYRVYLFDDPDPLAGGQGVRVKDRFVTAEGLILEAEGPHRRAKGVGGLWVVDCTAVV